MSKTITKIADTVPPVIADSDSTVLSLLERALNDHTFPIDRFNQVFEFHQKVQADKAKKAWFAAFVQAEAEMEQIKRDASNPETHSKYATFETLDAAMRPIYSRFGFAFTHTTEKSNLPEGVLCVTFLVHKDGYERRYEIDMPADGKGPKGNAVHSKTHAVGSANTYGKRYNIGNAFNIATYKDDDGNAAGAAPVNTRAVVEQMPSDESAKKRDEILKSLRSYRLPLSPEDQSDFAEKFAADINSLRKDDAEKIRTDYAERKKAK